LGLACGIAAKRAGLSHLILEKGALVHSFVGYPTDLEFFSTPELLEIGGIPFTTRHYKPVRAEALEYYRHVARVEDLRIRLYERVLEIGGEVGGFRIQTGKGLYHSRHVVIATGFFDCPNPLDVRGSDLSKVIHYYKEPFAYAQQKVAVIGAKNSAAKAALDLYRHGAEVSLVIRGAEISDKVKYWIKPDLENRIQEGAIQAYYHSTVQEITERHLALQTPAGEVVLENDWVFAMTGYRPDFEMLRQFGLAFEPDVWQTPIHNRATMESNRAGVYLAGVVCGGLRTNVWFIENSRIHADMIVTDILQKSSLA
ncbi:MAG TPA: YpdA family putative bacillithiol disulfide reductase, partial [Rhodothermales bacterium]|nr:YpdA family putative bacillithiol disulfide reductase [Rhodothermales bacterium]